jgi:hypothetical protein
VVQARPASFRGRVAVFRAVKFAADQSATEQVTVDFARIGVSAKTATDALSREALKCADGKLTVPLQPMRMRLVWVE